MMKKMIFFINILVISGLIFGSSVYAQQTWQLYDDFSAATVDTNKWYVDDSSATITIENGRAKFVHHAGYGGDSSWLGVNQTLPGMSGLKATITVESCSVDNDVQSRIGGFIGTVGSDLAWVQQTIRPYQQKIVAGISIQGPAPAHQFKYNYFWGNYTNPMNVIGIPFTLTTIVSLSDTRHTVDGLGELDFILPAALGELAEDQDFIGIGTRSSGGIGTCTVYFDNVYVLADQQVSIVPIMSLLLKEKAK